MLSQEWNDFKNLYSETFPDNDEDQVEILAWAIRRCCYEIENVENIITKVNNDRLSKIFIDVIRFNKGYKLLAGICNKSAQGGGLKKQIDLLIESSLIEKRVPITLLK